MLSTNETILTSIIELQLLVLIRIRDEELIDKKTLKYFKAYFISTLKTIENKEEKD